MKLNAKSVEAIRAIVAADEEAIAREFARYEALDAERFQAQSTAKRAQAKARDDYAYYLSTQYNRMKEENAVYRGDYRHEVEQKNDAVEALGLASEAVVSDHEVNVKKSLKLVSTMAECVKSTSACTMRPNDGQHYSDQKLQGARRNRIRSQNSASARTAFPDHR